MKELLRTNDLVLMSYVRAILADHGIEVLVLDAHMSVVEGSIGALPRRLMVSQDDYPLAHASLKEAGILSEPEPQQAMFSEPVPGKA